MSNKLSLAIAAAGLALMLISFVPLPRQAPAQTQAPAASDQAAYGKALFSAKGCVSCHHHAAVPGSGALGEGPPDLISYRWNAEYLRRWLSNPAAVKPGTEMPTLGLQADEIEALIAFLSAGTKA